MASPYGAAMQLSPNCASATDCVLLASRYEVTGRVPALLPR